jgi:LPS export ABC transporter protein LptC
MPGKSLLSGKITPLIMSALKWISFFSIFLLGSCLQKNTDLELIYGKKEDLSEVAEDIDILYSENGIVQLRIKGPTLIRSSEQGQQKDEFPNGLEVTFYDEYGTERSWLSSKYGIRYPTDQKIVFQDSVVFKNIENETLKTSELFWYESDGSMESTKFVEIRRPGEIIRGFGFKAQNNLTRFELNAVTGRIKADDITGDFE